jgi:adenylate cyclase 10
VSLFDKDMIFLNIFGLRGFKHVNDAEIALRCAFEICETFKAWNEVEKVAVGVTSGISYCGIVGHSLRREYSAISVTVNRAARLMIAYPGIVSCDQETLMKSKMDLKHFKLLPLKSFKGLHGNVLAYRFQDISSAEELSIFRDTEVILYDRGTLLNKIKSLSRVAAEEFKSESIADFVTCFILKGSSQQGKSSILKELHRHFVRENVECIKFSLNTKHFSLPYWTVRNIVTKVIENLENDRTLSEFITDIFSNYHLSKYLAVLNPIFGTNFESNEDMQSLSEVATIEIQKVLLKILCSNLSKNHFYLILIDDADFMDGNSLNLMSSIIDTKAFFLILTIGKQCKKWTLKQKQIYMNERVVLHKLEPIDKTFHKNIACQVINASAIAIEFERFLHENSDGNPGWIETCTKTLLYSDKLEEVSMSVSEARLKGLILIEKLINQYDDVDGNDNGHRNSDIINAVVLSDEIHPSDYAGIDATNKLIQYDALSSFQDQLVCRCASVLGAQFNRNMLNYLMPECKDRDICKSIVQLFQLNIFACASPKYESRMVEDVEEEQGERISKTSDFYCCRCINVPISDSCRDLPRYSCCSFLKFQDDSFRQCVYNTLTERQRLDYHRKCFSYLYRNTVKCDTCGNHRQFEVMREIEIGECDGYMSFEKTCDDDKRAKLCDMNFKKNNNLKMFPIVLNYDYYNFMNCKCIYILDAALNDIIEHCRERDMIMKLLYSKVLKAEISIRLLNFPLAMDLLQKAMEKLEVKLFKVFSCFISFYFIAERNAS